MNLGAPEGLNPRLGSYYTSEPSLFHFRCRGGGQYTLNVDGAYGSLGSFISWGAATPFGNPISRLTGMIQAAPIWQRWEGAQNLGNGHYENCMKIQD